MRASRGATDTGKGQGGSAKRDTWGRESKGGIAMQGGIVVYGELGAGGEWHAAISCNRG